MEEGHHLSSPGPPNSPNLEVQPVVSGGGREDPGYYGCHGNSRFSRVLQCLGVERLLVAEAYWAPGLQALPFLGR